MSTVLNIDLCCEHIIGGTNTYVDELKASIESTYPFYNEVIPNLLVNALWGNNIDEFALFKKLDDIYFMINALEVLYEYKKNEDYGVEVGLIPLPESPLLIKTLTCNNIQNKVNKIIILP